MSGTYRLAAAVVLLSAPLLAGCGASDGDGGADAQVLQAGDSSDDLTITLASTPDPLEAGDNDLEVTVTGPDGAPVTDATVNMVFSMPAMPSMNMPAMRSDAMLQHDADGRYRGTGQLSMGGTWNVTLTVQRGSEQLGTRRLSVVARE